jgi:transposase-like protein
MVMPSTNPPVSSTANPISVNSNFPVNPEVLEKPERRRYSAEYKLRILQEADSCEPGQIGAILRREGLYSSHLTTWRRQRQQGQLAALSEQKRGRQSQPVNPLAKEVERLRRENHRLLKRMEQLELLVDIQKKACTILGITLEMSECDGSV